MPPVRQQNADVARDVRRNRTVSRVVQARRRLDTLPRGGGRAWINGREVGGPDGRYEHLSKSYD